MTSNNAYDLNDAIKELEYILVGHPKTSARGQAVLCAIDALEYILNGDLVPVIHAKWINKEHKMIGLCPCCTNCNGFNPIETRYCPNCGAKMEEIEQ